MLLNLPYPSFLSRGVIRTTIGIPTVRLRTSVGLFQIIQSKYSPIFPQSSFLIITFNRMRVNNITTVVLSIRYEIDFTKSPSKYASFGPTRILKSGKTS